MEFEIEPWPLSTDSKHIRCEQTDHKAQLERAWTGSWVCNLISKFLICPKKSKIKNSHSEYLNFKIK